MTLIDELTTEALTRDQDRGWTRENVESLPELRNPELLLPYRHVFMGEKSLTIRDIRHRKIVESDVSNGQLARLYMKRIMAEDDDLLSKRVPYRRDALQFNDRRPAHYFAGQCGGPFVLVDITACYATLYSRLTLDLTYRPDCDPPLLGIGRGCFPRKEEWLIAKGPRNSLFGCIWNQHGREWRNGEPIDNAYPNTFFAPDLRGIVLDACHAIAGHARENGALSWDVDGGAFRPDKGRVFIEWLRGAFGLEATIRSEGPGWLFGASSWRIGPDVTEDVRKGRANEWPETDKLRPIPLKQRAWLADIFKERQ